MKPYLGKFSYFLVGMLFWMLPAYCFGEVLFQDNFDGHNDWRPRQPTGSSYNCGENCTTQPDGYHSYYIKRTVYSSPGENTIRITGDQHRGASGKAFIHWSESNASENWPSDGILSVKLPGEYTELYYRFYIKFQSNWQWASGMSPGQKFSRVSHYVGGAPFSYHDPRNQRPLSTVLLNKSSSSSYVRTTTNFRYEIEKYPSDANPSHDDTEDGDLFKWGNSGEFGDGEWHCVEHYVKLNSSIGKQDGVVKLWVDGNLVINVTDLMFGDSGGRSNPRSGWNYVAIGGNSNNPFAPASQRKEQWYAIDDFVISTTRIGCAYSSHSSDGSPGPQIINISIQ